MASILRLFAAMLLMLSNLLPACANSLAAEDLSLIATRLLDHMEAGRFAQATDDFNNTMKATLDAAKLEEVQRQLEGAGQVKQRGTAKFSKVSGTSVVTIRIIREAATLDAVVAFDADGKVAGLHFVPATEPRSQAPPPDSSLKEDEVKVGIGARALPGTLTWPSKVKKSRGSDADESGAPAVVLVHGSGPQDRNETVGESRPFFDLAQGLAQRGVAVLRYEKRTKARPSEFVGKSFSIDDEVTDDAVAAALMLRGLDGIDSTRVFVLGHSLGGMLAPRIAARSLAAGAILLAAPARPMLTLLSEQMHRSILADGVVTEKEERAQAELDRKIAHVKRSDAASSSSEQTPFNLPLAYWLSVTEVDAVGDAGKLTRPILLLQGGRDTQVVDQDWAIWKAALSRRANVTFKHYQSLGHLGIAVNAGGLANGIPNGRVDPVLIGDIAT